MEVKHWMVWTGLVAEKRRYRHHRLYVGCIYHYLPYSKLTPLYNVVTCVLLHFKVLLTLVECVWFRCRCVFFSPNRPPWSLCQGCRGRFRAMPLNRHCEEHTWPQVESTLWPVSPRDFGTSYVVISNICFQKGKKNPSLFIWIPPTFLITNSRLRPCLVCYNALQILCLSFFNL